MRYLILSLIFPLILGAQLKVSVTNGNWGTASTWSPTGVPSTSDKVKIYHSVTLNQNALTSDTIFVLQYTEPRIRKNTFYFFPVK